MIKKSMPKLFILLIIISGCGETRLNQVVVDEESKQKILIGQVNHEGFIQEPFHSWFEFEYESYQPADSVIQKLQETDYGSIDIHIVMGTWCSDSRRELPRFIKIAEQIGHPPSKMKIIGVNSKKTVPGIMLDSYNFERVPTFIFYKEGNEIGRIIETPVKSLEEDLLEILTKI